MSIAPLPSSLRLWALTWLLALLCGVARAGPAEARPAAPNPREWATAQCVAALDVQTEALALQVKAGRADLRGLLRARLKSGAAFIGQAWLDGERDEARSQSLLKQALEAQRGLSAADLAARQNRCAAEADKLLDQANALSRAVVSRLADRRMKKLLEG
ncbi:MAG: hypothetical protein KBC73_16970 [Burkholderiaceae bacterium]|nr:hypothetical protein [Burkholderiaceae bacterium]